MKSTTSATEVETTLVQIASFVTIHREVGGDGAGSVANRDRRVGDRPGRATEG